MRKLTHIWIVLLLALALSLPATGHMVGAAIAAGDSARDAVACMADTGGDALATTALATPRGCHNQAHATSFGEDCGVCVLALVPGGANTPPPSGHAYFLPNRTRGTGFDPPSKDRPPKSNL